MLDLALDIDFLEGLGLRSFEDYASFSTNETKAVFLFCKKMLPVVVADELRGIAVGFEAEFFGDES